MSLTRIRLIAALVGALVLAGHTAAFAVDAEQLSGLLHYKISSVTTLTGKWNGSMPGQRIKLDNQMEFEFTTYGDDFLVDPRVIIFEKALSAESLAALVPTSDQFLVYQIIIGNKLYPALRVK